MGHVLYVGCGRDAKPLWLPPYDKLTRLDIDPDCAPDIVADMRDMGEIGQFDMLYCSHALEHLYPHEVSVALGEFYRVLSPRGVAVILVPDLEDVRPTEDVLFTSAAGPITGLDLMYGKHDLIEAMPYMAHHCGFTSATLTGALSSLFPKVATKRMTDYNLLAVASK